MDNQPSWHGRKAKYGYKAVHCREGRDPIDPSQGIPAPVPNAYEILLRWAFAGSVVALTCLAAGLIWVALGGEP